MNKLSVILVIASALFLSACGLKGDLYYPDASNAQESTGTFDKLVSQSEDR